MTVASAVSRNDYVGNGAVDTYAYSFKIFAETHLLVTIRDTSDAETTLSLTTHYTVTGVGVTNGGNVVLVNGGFAWLDGDGDLLTGYTLTIRRVLPLTQLTDIRNQGSFFPEIHEDQFDRMMQIAQQQQDELDRSMKLPETIDPDDVSPTLPVPVGGQVLAWKADETGLENKALQVTSVSYAGTISAGLDASKPGSPTTNDIYVATDTKRLYICFASPTWTAVNAMFGTDAAKTATPQVGQIYIATDTAKLYICNTVNVWTQNGALASNLTGRMTNANMPLAVAPVVVNIGNSGTSAATDASLGNVFKITANNNFTLANPTNPTDGQKIIWRITQDGTGSRVITLGSAFRVSEDINAGAIVLSTTAAKVDYLGAIYNSDATKWDIIAFAKDVN